MQRTGSKAKSRLSYAKDSDPLFKRLLIRTLEVLTGQKRIQRLYHEIYDMDIQPHEVWGAALSQLEIVMKFDSSALDNVPRESPLVFVSNHPYGVLDGLMLGHLVSQVRPKLFGKPGQRSYPCSFPVKIVDCFTWLLNSTNI